MPANVSALTDNSGNPMDLIPLKWDVLTPSNDTTYNPPITLWIWDADATNVNMEHYNLSGVLIETILQNAKQSLGPLPLRVTKVLPSGTTATTILGMR